MRKLVIFNHSGFLHSLDCGAKYYGAIPLVSIDFKPRLSALPDGQIFVCDGQNVIVLVLAYFTEPFKRRTKVRKFFFYYGYYPVANEIAGIIGVEVRFVRNEIKPILRDIRVYLLSCDRKHRAYDFSVVRAFRNSRKPGRAASPENIEENRLSVVVGMMSRRYFVAQTVFYRPEKAFIP